MESKVITGLDYNALHALAVENGSIEISENMHLYDSSILSEFQDTPGKLPLKNKIDYSIAPMWLVVFGDTLDVAPIHSINQLTPFLERLDIK